MGPITSLLSALQQGEFGMLEAPLGKLPIVLISPGDSLSITLCECGVLIADDREGVGPEQFDPNLKNILAKATVLMLVKEADDLLTVFNGLFKLADPTSRFLVTITRNSRYEEWLQFYHGGHTIMVEEISEAQEAAE